VSGCTVTACVSWKRTVYCIWSVVEGLKDEGRGHAAGRQQTVQEILRSEAIVFGHLERSNSLKDGDKPGTFFRGQRDRLSTFLVK
jgi:hypothetical protein